MCSSILDVFRLVSDHTVDLGAKSVKNSCGHIYSRMPIRIKGADVGHWMETVQTRFSSTLFVLTSEKTDEMDEQQRKTLASKLSALLGFEDGADDVLAHLLTIQTQDVSAEKEHGPVLACLISRTVLVDCQACSCVVVIRDNN